MSIHRKMSSQLNLHFEVNQNLQALNNFGMQNHQFSSIIIENRIYTFQFFKLDCVLFISMVEVEYMLQLEMER